MNELLQEFKRDPDKYRYEKKVVVKDICKTCEKVHRSKRNYVWCAVAHEFNKKRAKKLPTWKPEGSREEWVKNFGFIRDYYWHVLSWEILKRDNRTCQECGLKGEAMGYYRDDPEFETHHIIPRCEGGSDHPHNLKTLCKAKCHRNHTNKLMKSRRVT